MSALTLQIAVMVAVLGSLVWLATRRSRPRGARRRSDDGSSSNDGVYNFADAGPHYGAGSFDGGSGHSAGSGDSGGGGDGSGGGDGGGGGSSD